MRSMTSHFVAVSSELECLHHGNPVDRSSRWFRLLAATVTIWVDALKMAKPIMQMASEPRDMAKDALCEPVKLMPTAEAATQEAGARICLLGRCAR